MPGIWNRCDYRGEFSWNGHFVGLNAFIILINKEMRGTAVARRTHIAHSQSQCIHRAAIVIMINNRCNKCVVLKSGRWCTEFLCVPRRDVWNRSRINARTFHIPTAGHFFTFSLFLFFPLQCEQWTYKLWKETVYRCRAHWCLRPEIKCIWSCGFVTMQASHCTGNLTRAQYK